LIAFHAFLSETKSLTVHLSTGPVELTIDRTMCLDKACLCELHPGMLCAVCQATSEEVSKGIEGDARDVGELLTLFQIPAEKYFSDVCFHGPKRFVENLLDRHLREITAISAAKSDTRDCRERLIANFELWMQHCSPGFHVTFRTGNTFPNPIKLTYRKMKSVFKTVEQYLKTILSTPNEKIPESEEETHLSCATKIWTNVEKMFDLAKTKTKDLSFQTVADAKALGN
jgi:hypothetical protein